MPGKQGQRERSHRKQPARPAQPADDRRAVFAEVDIQQFGEIGNVVDDCGAKLGRPGCGLGRTGGQRAIELEGGDEVGVDLLPFFHEECEIGEGFAVEEKGTGEFAEGPEREPDDHQERGEPFDAPQSEGVVDEERERQRDEDRDDQPGPTREPAVETTSVAQPREAGPERRQSRGECRGHCFVRCWLGVEGRCSFRHGFLAVGTDPSQGRLA